MDRARAGDMITSSGSMPSRSLQNAAQLTAAVALLPPIESSRRVILRETVFTHVSSRPAARRCSITSGTPPARNTCTVAKLRGPLGSASTSRGTCRFTSVQSAAVGRCNPAAWAMAGMCNSRFVEPPKAACTTMALRMAAWRQDILSADTQLMQAQNGAARAARGVEPDGLA